MRSPTVRATWAGSGLGPSHPGAFNHPDFRHEVTYKRLQPGARSREWQDSRGVGFAAKAAPTEEFSDGPFATPSFFQVR